MRALGLGLLILLAFAVPQGARAQSSRGWCETLLTVEQLGPVEPEVAAELEQAAYDAMEHLTLGGEQAATEVQAWFSRIRDRQNAGQRLSVLEHTTLVYALRSGFFERFPDAELAHRIEQALTTSWFDLTGEVPEDLLARLPRRVLRKEPLDVQQFHAAAFQNLPPREAGREAALGRDFVGRGRDLVPALLVLAIGFSETGSQALAGTMMGLAMASLHEHLIHRYIAHASKKLEAFYDRLGWLGRTFRDTKYSHAIIHHGKTFRVYNRQFAGPEDEAAVDSLLAERGRDAFSIIGSRYGLSLGTDGVMGGMALTLPFTAAFTALVHFGASRAGLHPSAVFDAAAISTSLLYIPLSKYVHPYLHMSRAEANDAAGPLMRWLLDTRYVALISRLHYGHHKGRGGNYNLLFGADAVLGQLRKPTIRQLLEMKKLGLFL